MRSQVIPLLFEDCRIAVKRFKYEVPHIKWIRTLNYKLDYRQLYKDLPLSDLEFCLFHPEAALDLCVNLKYNNKSLEKRFVM